MDLAVYTEKGQPTNNIINNIEGGTIVDVDKKKKKKNKNKNKEGINKNK